MRASSISSLTLLGNFMSVVMTSNAYCWSVNPRGRPTSFFVRRIVQCDAWSSPALLVSANQLRSSNNDDCCGDQQQPELQQQVYPKSATVSSNGEEIFPFDLRYSTHGPVGLSGNFIISREGPPTKEELSNENLLKIVTIECNDLEVSLTYEGHVTKKHIFFCFKFL